MCDSRGDGHCTPLLCAPSKCTENVHSARPLVYSPLFFDITAVATAFYLKLVAGQTVHTYNCSLLTFFFSFLFSFFFFFFTTRYFRSYNGSSRVSPHVSTLSRRLAAIHVLLNDSRLTDRAFDSVCRVMFAGHRCSWRSVTRLC